MEEKFTAFLRVIDPADNVTGGGAASAAAGAMAASLVGMVARLSVGRKNMAHPDAFYEETDRQARALSDALFAGSNADSAAFDAVMAAFRLPRETDSEKNERSAAIQAATIGATEIPVENAERCATVLRLARPLIGKSNPNAASDLECARFLAEAGLKGALSNAEININAIKDAETAVKFQQKVDALRQALGE